MDDTLPAAVFAYTHNDDAPRNHKEVISLHLFGRSRTEIAKIVGLSEDQVSRVLVHPPNAEYIRGKMNSLLVETSNAAVDFVGLVSKAVKAVKTRLEDDESPREQLAAAKLVLELVNFGNPDGAAANLGRPRGASEEGGGVSDLKADVRAGDALEAASKERLFVTNEAAPAAPMETDRFAFLRDDDEGVANTAGSGDNLAVPLAGTPPEQGGSGVEPGPPASGAEDEEGLGF